MEDSQRRNRRQFTGEFKRDAVDESYRIIVATLPKKDRPA